MTTNRKERLTIRSISESFEALPPEAQYWYSKTARISHHDPRYHYYRKRGQWYRENAEKVLDYAK